MAKFKEGDNVKVAVRDQTPADVKSQLYYPHYAGLRGAILKVYGEEASVLVDRDTLTTEVRSRHEESERAMRQRWLDGLSDEARNRLTAREKDFTLNYAVLVSVADLVVDRGAKATPGAPAAAAPVKATAEEKRSAKETAKSVSALDVTTGESSNARRLSGNDLDAAEEAFLAQRSSQ